MGIFKKFEWLIGTYKTQVPIIKLRGGDHPVWVMDYAKKIKGKGNIVEYETYKTNARFTPPRANEIHINDKGKDVFPKVMLDDGILIPLVFSIEEKNVFICNGCQYENDDVNSVVTHIEKCDRIKEMLNAREPT